MFAVPILRHLWVRRHEAHEESVRKLTWARMGRRWIDAWPG